MRTTGTPSWSTSKSSRVSDTIGRPSASNTCASNWTTVVVTRNSMPEGDGRSCWSHDAHARLTAGGATIRVATNKRRRDPFARTCPVLRWMSAPPILSNLNLAWRQYRCGIVSIPDGLRVRSSEVGSQPREARHRLQPCTDAVERSGSTQIPARSIDEPRTQVIGRIGDVVWSAFITTRGDRIRIISVRRARDEEKAAYLQD